MKRTLVVLSQSLAIAYAAAGTSFADEAIGPGHPRWFGNGPGPTGADLITWVSHRATKAPSGSPDPAYYGPNGPTGADLIAKLAKVQRKDQPFDLVNTYGQGAPSAQQLSRWAKQEPPVFARGPVPTVK